MAVTPVASDGDCAGHSGVVAVVAPIACNKQYNNGGGATMCRSTLTYLRSHAGAAPLLRLGAVAKALGMAHVYGSGSQQYGFGTIVSNTGA